MATLRESIVDDIVGDDVFYNTDTGFAETITYVAGADFVGLWEEDYIEQDADGYIQASSTAPACWCRTTVAPTVGQTINRGSIDYVIVEHQPNDDGETLLILRRA